MVPTGAVRPSPKLLIGVALGMLLLGGAAFLFGRPRDPDPRAQVTEILTRRFGKAEAERRIAGYERDVAGKSEGGHILFWEQTLKSVRYTPEERIAMAQERERRAREDSLKRSREEFARARLVTFPPLALLTLPLKKARNLLWSDPRVPKQSSLLYEGRLPDGILVKLDYPSKPMNWFPGSQVSMPLPKPLNGEATLPNRVEFDFTCAKSTTVSAAIERLGFGRPERTWDDERISSIHFPRLPQGLCEVSNRSGETTQPILDVTRGNHTPPAKARNDTPSSHERYANAPSRH